MVWQGEGNRMVAEHQLNRASSRSHTIFSIMLERSTDAAGDEMIVSKLNLVDLAGSERICKTKSEGLVLKEAQQINKSLSFLEQVETYVNLQCPDVPFCPFYLLLCLRKAPCLAYISMLPMLNCLIPMCQCRAPAVCFSMLSIALII